MSGSSLEGVDFIVVKSKDVETIGAICFVRKGASAYNNYCKDGEHAMSEGTHYVPYGTDLSSLKEVGFFWHGNKGLVETVEHAPNYSRKFVKGKTLKYGN